MPKKIYVEENCIIMGSDKPQGSFYTFPGIEKLNDGSLICIARDGSSKSSADGVLAVKKSHDGGKTWERAVSPTIQMEHSEPQYEYRVGGISLIKSSHLIAVFARVDRTSHPESLFNAENDGMLHIETWTAHSYDHGESWIEHKEVKSDVIKDELVLDTACLVIDENTIAIPCETWKGWDGVFKGEGQMPLMLMSYDGGRNFTETVVFGKECIGRDNMWDQRVCITNSGKIVCLIWTHDIIEDKDINAHAVFSEDGARTWSQLKSTPISSQIFAPCALGNDIILGVYNDRGTVPGLKAVLNYNDGRDWDIESIMTIHSPQKPKISNNENDSFFLEVNNYSFGGPNIVRLDDHTAFAVLYCSNGKGTFVKGIKIGIQ
jgi:hypothetical protein